MRELKNILKSSTYMVLPAVAALISGKSANAAVTVTAAPSAYPGLDKVVAPISVAMEKNFATQTAVVAGSVKEFLADANNKTTIIGSEGFAHVKYAPTTDGFITKSGTTWEIIGREGDRFIGEFQTANKDQILKHAGELKGAGINAMLVSQNSIVNDGKFTDFAALIVAAGQAVSTNKDLTKVYLNRVNEHAFYSDVNSGASLDDAGVGTIVAPNVVGFGYVAIGGENVKIVNASKATLSLDGGLIHFQTTAVKAEAALALGAKITGQKGLLLVSSSQVVDLLKGVVNTGEVAQHAVMDKATGNIEIGAGFAASSYDVTANKAKNAALLGSTVVVPSTAKITPARDLLIGGDLNGRGGFTDADKAFLGARKSSFIRDGGFTVDRTQNSKNVFVAKGAELTAGDKAILFAEGKLALAQGAFVSLREAGLVELSGKGSLDTIGSPAFNFTSHVVAPKGSLTYIDPKNIVISTEALLRGANPFAGGALPAVEAFNATAGRLLNALGDAPSDALIAALTGLMADNDAVAALKDPNMATKAQWDAYIVGAAGIVRQNDAHTVGQTFNASINWNEATNGGVSSADTTLLSAADVNAAWLAGNVELQATNDIVVAANLSSGAADNILTLTAGHKVYVAANITATAGNEAKVVIKLGGAGDAVASAAALGANVAFGAYGVVGMVDQNRGIFMTPTATIRGSDTDGPTYITIRAKDMLLGVAGNTVSPAIISLGKFVTPNGMTAANAANILISNESYVLAPGDANIVSATGVANGNFTNIVDSAPIFISSRGGSIGTSLQALTLNVNAANMRISAYAPQGHINVVHGVGANNIAYGVDVDAAGWVAAGLHTYLDSAALAAAASSAATVTALLAGLSGAGNTAVIASPIGKHIVTGLAGLADGADEAAIQAKVGAIAENDAVGFTAAVKARLRAFAMGDGIAGIKALLAAARGVGRGAAATQFAGFYAGQNMNVQTLAGQDISLPDLTNVNASAIFGGSFVAPHGNTVVRSGQDIITPADDNHKAVIKGKNIALIVGRTVGENGALTAVRAIPVSATESVVGYASTGKFGIKSLVDLNVGVTDLANGIFAPLFNAAGVAAAAPARTLANVATNAAQGYIWNVTTANAGGAHIGLLSLGKINLKKAADGTIATVTALDAGGALSNIGLLAATGITGEAGHKIASLNAATASGISLDTANGDIGSLALPINVSGAHVDSWLNTRANTADKHVYLNPTSNFVLGGGDLAGTTGVDALANRGASVSGLGNAFINGGQYKLTLVNAADAISLETGLAFIAAGEIDGAGVNSGITGTRASFLATRFKNVGGSGRIGATHSIRLTLSGAGTAAGVKEFLVEASTRWADLATDFYGVEGADLVAAKLLILDPNLVADRDVANSREINLTSRVGGGVVVGKTVEVDGLGAYDTFVRVLGRGNSLGAGIGGGVFQLLGAKTEVGISSHNSLITLGVEGVNSKWMFGAAGSTDDETVVNARNGGLRFLYDNLQNSGFLTAQTKAVLSASSFVWEGGHANSIFGLPAVEGQNKDLRVQLKAVGTAYRDADKKVEVKDIAILSTNGWLGATYANLTGSAIFGSLNAGVAKAAFAGAHGVLADYGLTLSQGAIDAPLVPAGVALGAQTQFATNAAGGSDLYLTVSEAFYLSSDQDNALKIANAAAAGKAVLKGKSLNYFALDGVDGLVGDHGRVALSQGSSLRLILEGNAGDQQLDTNGNKIVDKNRVKIGVSTADQTAYLLGNVGSARFTIVNEAGPASRLSFGLAKGGVVGGHAKLFANQVQSYEDRYAAKADQVGANTFQTTDANGVLSLANDRAAGGTGTVNTAQVIFTGDAWDLNDASKQTAALTLAGKGAFDVQLIDNTAGVVIDVNTLMIKTSTTVGAGQALLLKQAADAWLGLDATAAATISFLAGSTTTLGHATILDAANATDSDKIDGLGVFGVRTNAPSAIRAGDNANFALRGLVNTTVGDLTVSISVSNNAKALLDNVSFAGDRGVLFDLTQNTLAGAQSATHLEIANLAGFKKTGGIVEFRGVAALGGASNGRTITLTKVATGVFEDAALGVLSFNGETVSLNGTDNFNKAGLRVTQKKGNWELDNDMTAGSFNVDLGEGSITNPNGKKFNISTAVGAFSLRAYKIGEESSDKSKDVIISAAYTAGAAGFETHQITLQSTGQKANTVYGLYATLQAPTADATKRVIYDLGSAANAVSVEGKGDLVLTVKDADYILSVGGAHLTTIDGNVSVLDGGSTIPESRTRLGSSAAGAPPAALDAASVISAGGKNKTITLEGRSFGSAVAANNFFTFADVGGSVVLNYLARDVAGENTTQIANGGFWDAGAAVFSANTASVTLNGGDFRIFNIDGADFTFAAAGLNKLSSLTVNAKSLTKAGAESFVGNATAKTVLNLNVTDSSAWNFGVNTTLSGTVGSLAATTLTNVNINGLAVKTDAAITLAAAPSTLKSDFTVGGKLTLAGNQLLNGSFLITATELAMNSTAAQTLKTAVGVLSGTAFTGATINNTSELLTLNASTLAVGGLTLNQTGDFAQDGALGGNNAFTLKVSGKVTKAGELTNVTTLTFTGDMAADAKFTGNVATLALKDSVGRFALDNGANAITINAFKGQADSSDITVSTTGVNHITLGGKLESLKSLTLSAVGGNLVANVDWKSSFANIGSLSLTDSRAMTVGGKGEIGFAGVAGVKLADFGSKNLTLTTAGLVTVTALAADADSYDFSGVDSFTLGGGFIDAAVPATNAVNFARIKGLKSFGVVNTDAGTAITVALDGLENGLAKSESAGLLTVSHATLINVLGFSGAGNLAFGGAATKATVSHVGSSSISALGKVTDLTLTDSAVDALKTLTKAVSATDVAGAAGVASLTTLNFTGTAGDLDLSKLAVAGAKTLVVSTQDSTVDGAKKSKMTGTFANADVTSAKLFANEFAITSLIIGKAGTVDLAGLKGGATSGAFVLGKDGAARVTATKFGGSVTAVSGFATKPTLLLVDGGKIESTNGFTLDGASDVAVDQSPDFSSPEGQELIDVATVLMLESTDAEGVVTKAESTAEELAVARANKDLIKALMEIDVTKFTEVNGGKAVKTGDAIKLIGAVETSTAAATADISTNVPAVFADAFDVAAFDTGLVVINGGLSNLVNNTSFGYVAPVAAPTTTPVAAAPKAAVTVDAAKKDEKKAKKDEKKKSTAKAKVAAAPAASTGVAAPVTAATTAVVPAPSASTTTTTTTK